MTVFNQSVQEDKERKKKARKRVRRGDAEDVGGYLGPWAPQIKTDEEQKQWEEELTKRKEDWQRQHPENEQRRNRRRMNPDINNTTADADDDGMEGTQNRGDDEEEGDAEEEQKRELKRKQRYEEQMAIEGTEFFGENEHDYQGRTYMYCPPDKKKRSNSEGKYYIPKKKIHTWLGHKDGVNSIKWFPKTGHLLLSCSNDTTVKLWDVHNDRRCLRSYNGHTAGVRNICFNHDGSKFLTTSFDRWLKLWDTETGKVIWRGSSGKIPFDAKLYPENENEFLCGQKNKIAVQWDIRANKIVQNYEEHLQAVNAILFIDDNRRFVTSSDDKKIFIWDYGVPVVIKHIADPSLHSVPFLTLHPNKKWFLGTSLDNQIVVYGAANRFSPNSKKHFRGHMVAGYSCQIDVSPDGRFVMSGDAQGRVFFWDWKTSRVYETLKASHKVVMGCIWHPVMTSKVATCSWDGTIQYWD
ncbi:hypothetical protein RFI_08745 [Reticulomyxa filosa]|uniref:Pre-mRNA-processing factor 17 n=1 Tax=Reticulomyxa filosa TaxID=46433 RepID=X6NQ49_RETFI|nr:hypothetical protein RFI_08745 [Reticulomyxa filosa]|eukprot:ETO28390.1 hypothetical protein RFI_08745 [Reticulomyxa filosa]